MCTKGQQQHDVEIRRNGIDIQCAAPTIMYSSDRQKKNYVRYNIVFSVLVCWSSSHNDPKNAVAAYTHKSYIITYT